MGEKVSYIGNVIVELSTEDDKRFIHFYAYGYVTDNQKEETPYRFLEYVWFIVPLEEVLEVGIGEYECENSDQYKQYIEDCTEENCNYRYEHYDNGKMPKVIKEKDVDMNTPDGMYILLG